jgi:hypothetical protein
MNRLLILFVAMACHSNMVAAKVLEPECGGPNHATLSPVIKSLKARGYIDADPVNSDIKITPIGYKKIGKDLEFDDKEGQLMIYEQTQHVTITRHDKPDIVLITQDDVSLSDCTYGYPKVIMLAPDLGILPYGKPGEDFGYEDFLQGRHREKTKLTTKGNPYLPTQNLIGFPVKK